MYRRQKRFEPETPVFIYSLVCMALFVAFAALCILDRARADALMQAMNANAAVRLTAYVLMILPIYYFVARRGEERERQSPRRKKWRRFLRAWAKVYSAAVVIAFALTLAL